MSQAKVDRYKEQKKNRKKIMAKEKRERVFTAACAGVIGIAIVAWCGISIYNNATGSSSEETETVQATEYSIDMNALDDYMNSLVEE